MGFQYSCVVRDLSLSLSWFSLSCLALLGRFCFESLNSGKKPLLEVCSWPFLEIVGLDARGG